MSDTEDRTQAEEEFRKLREVLPQYMCVYTADVKPLYASDELLDYFGFTQEDFRADDFQARAFHPEDLERIKPLREAAMARGEGWVVEARIKRKDGQYRWFLIRGKPLRNDAGEIVRWFSSGTDIEDRKEAEEELQRKTEVQAVYKQLIDSSMDGILAFDREGRYTVWNPGLERIFGIKEADRLGRAATDICPFFRLSGGQNCYAETLSGKGMVATDIPYTFADTGKQIFLDGHFSPLLNTGGETIGGVAIIRDVTERKQAQRELQQIVDAVPQIIFVLGPDGKRLYYNKVVQDYSGWTLEDLLDEEKAKQTFHPDDLAHILESRRRGIERGLPFRTESRIRRKDGQYRWFLALYNPFKDEQGNIIRWYCTGTDIEDRKQAEEALRRSEAYLAEAQRLSHSGSFAHDPVHGEITYWSAETYRTFGFDPANGLISFQEARSRVHPEDLRRFDEARERGIREKTGTEIDFRIVLPDQSIKHIHCVSRPLLNPAGEVIEMVGTNIDVTEQYHARAALEKAFEEIKELKDELYRENLALREEIDHASMFEEIVGTSEALRHVLVQLAKVAPTDSTVLISGETGTGKELVSRAIHKRSPRRERPFVSVNCAAIPSGLIGSELFGHEKGAFTGATQRRLGRFELANGGTLFLDEVGDLPAETQIALLRVLQERQFERVGGTHPIAVDVRIITATNRDLKTAVAAGTFREDLYYRLNVFPIAVPPLRDRKDDIPLLVEYFTERYASKAGKKIRNIDKRTLELLTAYHWPGNIRELQNVIERGVILCDGNSFSVDESWLQLEPQEPLQRTGNGLARPGADEERKLIESALAASNGRISGPTGAAAKLGIPRSTLETKIKKLGIAKYKFKSA